MDGARAAPRDAARPDGGVLGAADGADAGALTRRTGADRLLAALVALIGVHSCVLGGAMLFAPLWMAHALGFEEPASPFFPSQSGIFLLVLGGCYLLALRRPALVAVIVVSKALAVPFLVIHAAFLDAPPSIWAAAAGDGSMLAALLLVLSRRRRQ
jgi:hypothetical protein